MDAYARFPDLAVTTGNDGVAPTMRLRVTVPLPFCCSRGGALQKRRLLRHRVIA